MNTATHNDPTRHQTTTDPTQIPADNLDPLQSTLRAGIVAAILADRFLTRTENGETLNRTFWEAKAIEQAGNDLAAGRIFRGLVGEAS